MLINLIISRWNVQTGIMRRLEKTKSMKEKNQDEQNEQLTLEDMKQINKTFILVKTP